jgi:hypothetical protein
MIILYSNRREMSTQGLKFLRSSGGVQSGSGLVLSCPNVPSPCCTEAPVGSIVLYAGGSNRLPLNWWPCDGRTYDPRKYPTLFGAIGNKFGVADGFPMTPNLNGGLSLGFQDASNNLFATFMYILRVR